MESKKLIKEIIVGILEFRIIPFFGAGMSIPFGFKDWDHLINDLKKEVGTTSSDYLAVAQEYENEFGRNKLLRKLESLYTISDIDKLPTENHQMVLAMNPPIIYTTNYDEALEKTADKIGRVYHKVSGLTDIISKPHEAKMIVKFHGDFSAPDEIVLTQKDYDRRMSAENALDIIFRSHLLGKGFFFMGYSLRDINIDFLFERHAKLYRQYNLPTSYIVVFEEHYSKARELEFKNKNIQTILLKSHEELGEILREIGQEVYQRDAENQFNALFDTRPKLVLLENELINLEGYLKSTKFTDLEKAEKLELTLSSKSIPLNIRGRVSQILINLLNESSFPDDAMNILLRALDWIELSKDHLNDLGIALIGLSSRPTYQRLQNFPSINLSNPIITAQRLFGEKITVLFILAFLTKVREVKKSISEGQLQELYDHLRTCKYLKHEFNEISPEEIEELINHFFRKHPRIRRKDSSSSEVSFNDIRNEISKQFPKGFFTN